MLSKILDVDELKRRINSEWAALRHEIIEHAVGEWCQRLHASAFARGEHFEHMLIKRWCDKTRVIF